MFEEALSMVRRSSGVRSTFAAPRFSSRRCSLVVPGIGTIHGLECESVQPRVQALLWSTADAGHQSASAGRLCNGQRLTTLQIILSRWSATLPLDRQAVAQRGGRLEYFTIAWNRFNWPLRYRLGCRSWMRTPLSEPRKSCPLWRGSGLLASSPAPFRPQLEVSKRSRQRRLTRPVRK